jgi:hypothetical protein
MYFAVAKNKFYVQQQDIKANDWADKAKKHYEQDSLLTIHYNKEIANGKWNHFMDQTHIGYTIWQQPERNVMPTVTYVDAGKPLAKQFTEQDGYVSIEAENFARSQGTETIRWTVIPDLGRTESAVTTLPQNVYPKENENIYLEYDIVFASTGTFDVQLLLAPTLNFNANKGLRYAISFDGSQEEIVNFNGHYRGELGPWQGESIIKSSTNHTISAPGKHTLRFRVLEPGIVLEKILINTGGLKPAYLGAPESKL